MIDILVIRWTNDQHDSKILVVELGYARNVCAVDTGDGPKIIDVIGGLGFLMFTIIIYLM